MKTKFVSFTVGALFALGATAVGQPVSLESAPPVVVKTEPVAGTANVDPRTSEIVVQFSKPMQGGSWSWSTWGEENFPEMVGQPKYAADGRTCVLKVKLQPGKFYATWLNSDKFKNFKDTAGRPAVPYLLTFFTSGTAAQVGGRDEAFASRPMEWLKEVNVDLNRLDPQNALLTQVMIEDLQRNGNSRFRNVIRTVNRGSRPQRKLQFQNSDFVDLQRLVDADGNSIPFTTVHNDRHFQYSAALTEPVPPGGALIYGSEGTTRDKVNHDALSGAYSYRFSHSPGSGVATRRVEIHRLPQGAKLLAVAPNATVRESKEPNGRPEVFLDQIVEPGGSVTLEYSYRLSETGLSGSSSGGVLAPKVVSMTPANGATDVDPALTEIKVVFDQPMMDRSWSMTGGGARFPEGAGDVRYDDKRMTWIAPVKLKPGWRYEFGLNSQSYRNFKSEKGVSLEPIWVTFTTQGGSDSHALIEREINALVEVFPAQVDLSTPEGACAAWQRASARRDAETISQLSLVPIDAKEEENWYRREEQRDAAGLAVYLKALADSKIVAVQTWRGELANVITFLPFPEGKGRQPYSARSFGLIRGEWKNLGEDRLPDLESAKAAFVGKKERLWEQYQQLKLQSAQSSPPVQTASPTTTAATLAPIPKAEELPGRLVFHGRYRHRSRGSDIDAPSQLWIKESPGGGLSVLADVPFMGTKELAVSDAGKRFVRFQNRGKSGYELDLELKDGSVKFSRRGVRQNVDGKELTVPTSAWFDPNTRPDSYVAANLLLRGFAVGTGETKEFRVYDWDNSGEALADYTIQVKHAGKEKVEVPAGTFEANHLVLTQLTSADTWFKKRAGHVTDFWVLDNQVIVRVLRHREPYEVVLLDYAVPSQPLPGTLARAKPATTDTAGGESRPDSGASATDDSIKLLNDDQRAVLAWTDRQFRSFFDARTFNGWSDEERATLERKLIDALNGPRSNEYYQAINTLAAMRSTKALPRLREIAFERVDRNNRDRWMCIRALGLMGDKESVPELIHLVYHGNQNTHWWAQISLVRLTGQNFSKDWNAWGKWWNDQKSQPPYKPEIIRWWNGQPEPDKLAQALQENDQKFIEGIKPK